MIIRGLAAAIAMLCLFLVVGPSTGQDSSKDEQEIRAIITGFSDTWARADVKAFENLLTEDAEWVVRSGRFLKGRQEVVAYHANLMASNFSGSRVAWQTLGIRFLRPDVAIAHVAAQLTLQDGTPRPPGTVTLVFTKGTDAWRITAVQNTDRASQ